MQVAGEERGIGLELLRVTSEPPVPEPVDRPVLQAAVDAVGRGEELEHLAEGTLGAVVGSMAHAAIEMSTRDDYGPCHMLYLSRLNKNEIPTSTWDGHLRG